MNGSGVQILAGANTYTGSTTISNGTLQLGSGERQRHAIHRQHHRQ